MKKLLITLLTALALTGAASAQTDVWNTSDTVISQDTVYTTEAFTADNLTELNANVSLDTNETLEATLKGFNDTEQTSNQSFSLADGSNTKTINSFSDNTTTYVVDFNATDGDVTILDAAITGDTIDTTVSGVAPNSGGLLTGNFFSGIPVIGGVFDWIGTQLNAIGTFLTEAWTV